MPESFTGYNAGGVQYDIWGMIYRENIFKLKFPDNVKEIYTKQLNTLMKLVSGIHTNTNMHICKFYSAAQTSECKANHTRYYCYLYVNTVGKHKDRIENLYYTFAFALSAFNNIQKNIMTYTYIQSNSTENEDIITLMSRLISDISQTNFVSFNDRDLCKTIKKQLLVDVIQPTFFEYHKTDQLSLLCKIKIEFNGLSAAMKILFPERSELYLSRNELIGLINLIQKLSDSINWYRDWLEFEKNMDEQSKTFGYFLFSLVITLYILGLLVSKEMHKSRTKEKDHIKVI